MLVTDTASYLALAMLIAFGAGIILLATGKKLMKKVEREEKAKKNGS